MAGAHKHTIWVSLGWGSHTIWSSLGQGSHTIWGSHGQGSHTQFGAHLAGPHTHTQFGAYISQSQSKFILVLFFQDSFIFQIYFENSGPQSTCYLEWTLTPFYCKWYGLEIKYILGCKLNSNEVFCLTTGILKYARFTWKILYTDRNILENSY